MSFQAEHYGRGMAVPAPGAGGTPKLVAQACPLVILTSEDLAPYVRVVWPGQRSDAGMLITPRGALLMAMDLQRAALAALGDLDVLDDPDDLGPGGALEARSPQVRVTPCSCEPARVVLDDGCCSSCGGQVVGLLRAPFVAVTPGAPRDLMSLAAFVQAEVIAGVTAAGAAK